MADGINDWARGVGGRTTGKESRVYLQFPYSTTEILHISTRILLPGSVVVKFD